MDYDTEYYRRRDRTPTFQAEMRSLHLALSSCLKRGGAILDVGCGSGRVSRFLGQQGADVVAMDWSSVAAEMAMTRGSPGTPAVWVVCGNAEHLPFPDGSLVGIAAQHLIEHFEEPTVVLREWRRVLQPGGNCAIITHNRRFPCPRWFDDPTHRHLFSPEELAHVAKVAGFCVDYVTTLNPYVLHPRFVFFAARHLQFLGAMPCFSRRGLSIMLKGTRV